MSEKTIYKIICAVSAAAIFVGIHLTQEFRFYVMEGNDLFIYDWNHIFQTLGQPGGLALLAASFVTQFMRVPFLGTLLTTLLYMSIGILLYHMLCRRKGGTPVSGLSFLPVAFLFLCLENDYYRFQGHVAFLIVVVALWGFFFISSDRLRAAYAVVLVPALYWLAGSVSAVFAVTVAVSEVTDRGFKGLWSLVCPALYLLTAYLMFRCSVIGSLEEALSPFMYYNHPSTYFFPLYAWASVPLLWFAAFLVSLLKMKPSKVWITAAAGIAFSIFIAGNLYSKVHSRSSYRLIQEQYWADKGDWDRIIETADRRQPTFLVSYLNLALAQKGILMERLPYFNPQPVDRIMLPVPNLKHGFSLQSKVYLSWGYVSAARQAAFDANLVTPGMHNPHLLKVLILTNMALDSYETAEKYIGILEKTLFYRKWAGEMRRILDDPSLAEEHPELSELRKAIPHSSGYIRHDGLKGDMRDILEAYPSHRILSQFYEVYMALEKEGER